MRVFLTGATGLLGSHAAEALAAAGHEVVALKRTESRTAGVAGVTRWVTGDVTEPADRLSRLMEGCEALVHAAALVYGRGASAADYRRLNVDAVETVLRAGARAGVTRAVAVASIAVYARGGGGPYTEESWRAGEIAGGALYAASKRAGEEAAWRVHDEGLVRLTTVRPGIIYGERDRWFTPILARAVRLPVLPLPGGGRTTVPVVYAGNVARGIVAALGSAEAAGEAFNLSGDEGLTARLLVESFARALGRKPWVPGVPGWPLQAVAAAADLVAGRLIPPGGGDTRGYVKRLMVDNQYPTAKARRLLRWEGEKLMPAPEALERTAAWWRSRPEN